MKRFSSSAALVAAIYFTSACYSYRAVAPNTMPEGSTIRVTVTPEEAVRQRDNVGEFTETLEGRLLQAHSDSLGLAVRDWQGGPADRPDFSTYVAIPRTSIVLLEEKRFSVGRTAVIAGAAVAAAAAILAISVESAGDTGEPPPTTELRIPIPISW